MEKHNQSPAKGCLVFWLSFLAGYIFQFLMLCVAIVIFKSLDLNTSTENLLSNIYVNLLLYLALYGAMLFTCLANTKPKTHIFKKPSALKMLIYASIAVVTFFAISPIVSCVTSWLTNAGLTPPTHTFKLTTTNYFIAIILLVILPATVEEILFRGAIFANMSKQGKTFASISTTLLFTLFHSSIFQTLYPIIFGLLLCVIMLREDNIYYCMVAHAVNNFLALTSLFFGWNLFSNGIWFIILAFVLAIKYITTLIFAFIKTKPKNPHEKQPLTNKDKIALIATSIVLTIIWICSSFLV